MLKLNTTSTLEIQYSTFNIIKKACPKKSRPLLTYEKHLV